jgi:Phospholipase_D-nuclease N-terminal
MLAYDYPLLGVFWSLFIFSFFVLWIFVVVWCFVDNLRRHDHHGLAKAMWFLALVFVPIVGVFAYLVSRPPAAGFEPGIMPVDVVTRETSPP